MRKLSVTDGQTDGQTDGRTDGGRCNISRPGPPAPREIINKDYITDKIFNTIAESKYIFTFQ